MMTTYERQCHRTFVNIWEWLLNIYENIHGHVNTLNNDDRRLWAEIWLGLTKRVRSINPMGLAGKL